MQRDIAVAPFTLTEYSDVDMIRPSMIKDLKVTEQDFFIGTIAFSFTAPGDDGDFGNCALYEILAAYDTNVLNDEYNSAINSDKFLPITLKSASFQNYKPNQGRSREFFTIVSDKYTKGDTFAIKIRSVDFSQNAGAWSPVLIVKLNPTIKLATNLRHITTEDLTATQKKLTSSGEAKESFYSRFLIGFAVCLILILVVQVGFIVVLSIVRAKQKIKAIRV
jgi:hypothetical protein